MIIARLFIHCSKCDEKRLISEFDREDFSEKWIPKTGSAFFHENHSLSCRVQNPQSFDEFIEEEDVYEEDYLEYFYPHIRYFLEDINGNKIPNEERRNYTDGQPFVSHAISAVYVVQRPEESFPNEFTKAARR